MPHGRHWRDFSEGLFVVGGRLRAPFNYIFPVKHSRLEGAEQSQKAPSSPKGGMTQCLPAYAPVPADLNPSLSVLVGRLVTCPGASRGARHNQKAPRPTGAEPDVPFRRPRRLAGPVRSAAKRRGASVPADPAPTEPERGRLIHGRPPVIGNRRSRRVPTDTSDGDAGRAATRGPSVERAGQRVTCHVAFNPNGK